MISAKDVVAVVRLRHRHEAGVVGLRRPGDEDAEGARRLLRRPDVQVVRERLGPVLPRVHRRVGADVALLPVGRRALRVVAVHRLRVVLALVAEQRAERVARAGLVDQDRLVVVAELVADVADHRAVRLAELGAALRADRVVGLREVDRDDAVGVPGHDRLPGARQQVEDELPLADREPDVHEHGQDAPLGSLGLREARQAGEVGVVGARPRQPAGEAERRPARRARASSCTPRAARWRSGGARARRPTPARGWRGRAGRARSPAASRSAGRGCSRRRAAGRSGHRRRRAPRGHTTETSTFTVNVLLEPSV